MKNLLSVHRAEKSMKLTPEGNGGYSLHPETMKPMAPKPVALKAGGLAGGMPKLGGMSMGGARTPAQQQAIQKAQAASAMKRRGT